MLEKWEMPGWSILVKGCRKGSVIKLLRVENRILRWSVIASGQNRLFRSQELEPKVGEELCRSWDVGQAGPSVRTPTSTNKTNRRGKPSVPTQPDRHPYPSQWEATQANVGNPAIQQVYTAHTPSLNSYPCAYSICVPRHPCPLSSPSSCCSPAHGCTHSRRCSLWSSRCCVAVSVSFSGSSIPRNHRAATTHEDDGAATTRHKSAV